MKIDCIIIEQTQNGDFRYYTNQAMTKRDIMLKARFSLYSPFVICMATTVPLSKYKKYHRQIGDWYVYWSPIWAKHFALEFSTTPVPLTDEAKTGKYLVPVAEIAIVTIEIIERKPIEIEMTISFDDLGDWIKRALNHDGIYCLMTVVGKRITNQWFSAKWIAKYPKMYPFESE